MRGVFRAHFLAVSAQIMRRIRLDSARKRAGSKRVANVLQCPTQRGSRKTALCSRCGRLRGWQCAELPYRRAVKLFAWQPISGAALTTDGCKPTAPTKVAFEWAAMEAPQVLEDEAGERLKIS